MAKIVTDRETDKCTPCSWIGMGSSLTGEVGEEQKIIAAGGYLGGRAHQLFE